MQATDVGMVNGGSTGHRAVARSAVLVPFVALACLVAGCGSQERSSGATSDSSASTQTHVPEELERVLAREGIEVADPPPSQNHPASEVLELFSEYYEQSSFESGPTVYTVEIVASNDSSLVPGRLVEMVHIPHVDQEANPPAAPRASDGATLEPTPGQIIETDMFTFFDATTDQHLVTVYIGPAPR